MWGSWQLCLGIFLWSRTTEGRHRVVPPGYRKDLRPATADGSPLPVGFSYIVDGIYAVNEEKMSITFQLYMRVVWQDTRLVYEADNISSTGDSRSDVAEECDLQPIHINSDTLQQELWRPDPFYRRLRSVTRYRLLEPVGGALLYPNLTVYSSMPLQLEVGCAMTFSNYPFDEQTCELYIGSYFYSLDDMEFYWLNLGVTLSDEVTEELAGYDFSLAKNDSMKCYCHKCVPKWSPCARTILRLSRRYVVHLMGYYVPSALFIIVSWCSFFWPPEVIPGRTVLGVTCLLTVVSLYADIRQSAPETSYVKAVDSWMFMTMLLTSSALFQYAVLLQLQKKTSSKTAAELVPKKAWSASTVSRPATLASFEGSSSATERTGFSGLAKVSELESLKPFIVSCDFKPGFRPGFVSPDIEFEVLNPQSRATMTYERQMMVSETVGRWGLPVVFVVFNLAYWPYYLF